MFLLQRCISVWCIKKFKTKNSPSLLFSGVTFYNVTTNTESANAEPLFPGEIRGRVPASPWPHGILDPYAALFYVRVHLKTPNRMHRLDSLTSHSRLTALKLTPDLGKPPTHTFSPQGALGWRAVESTSAPRSGGTSISNITAQSTKIRKQGAQRPLLRTFVQSGSCTGQQSVASFNLSSQAAQNNSDVSTQACEMPQGWPGVQTRVSV